MLTNRINQSPQSRQNFGSLIKSSPEVVDCIVSKLDLNDLTTFANKLKETEGLLGKLPTIHVKIGFAPLKDGQILLNNPGNLPKGFYAAILDLKGKPLAGIHEDTFTGTTLGKMMQTLNAVTHSAGDQHEKNLCEKQLLEMGKSLSELNLTA